jgi:PAS domain S-box-containing protein
MMFPSAAISVLYDRLRVVNPSRFPVSASHAAGTFSISVSNAPVCVRLESFVLGAFTRELGAAVSHSRSRCCEMPRFLLVWVQGYWPIVLLLFLVGVVSSAVTLYVGRRMQPRVGETAQRFHELVEALPDAILVVQDEQVVYINPYGLKLLGAENTGQVVGRNISEIVHPDSLESARTRLKELARTGKATAPKEHALRSFDGSAVAIESTSIPIRWLGEPAVGTIARDIRDRTQAEAKLKEYEQVVEGLDEMIVVLDRDYRHLIANRAFLSYRGVSREEIIGRSVAEIVGSEFFNSTTKEKLDECFQGQVVKFELKYAFSGIGERNLFVSYFPIHDGRGIDRITVVLQDITERKRSEQALLLAQAEVARVSRAITIGELTTTIAHEINQPLTAVVADVNASLRWLSHDSPDLAEARAAMEAAARAANRASEVIGRIRSLLRNAPSPLQRLDVVALIQEVLALADSDLRDQGIRVKTTLSENTPRVLGDRIQLQQVLLNLIMNAIDAMKTNGDRSRELFLTSSRHENSALIEVYDTGAGIDVARADLIFEPFFTTKAQGIGMGLTISRSIVEAHGGRLWATPNSPHGSVFHFTLQPGEENHV